MMMIEVPVPPALADRRNELKCFLRTRRERLQPADVNLPCGTRRRTPGLRREEVAELAGVGVAWYSWLEMGREIRVSSRMLLGIARALKLSEDETAYLFTLAGNAVPERDCDFPETVPVWMEEVLRRIRGPAYFIGRRLDVLAWNEHAERLFNFYESADPLQSNTVWRMFTDPVKRRLLVDWEREAAYSVATLRSHHVHFPGDPHFESLIAALHRVSAEFRSLWAEQDVRCRMNFDVTLDVPEVGVLEVGLVKLPLAHSSLQYIVVGCPKVSGETARKLERRLGSPHGAREAGEAII
jgi:transcriptional regulator with XRE-family HTH domain